MFSFQNKSLSIVLNIGLLHFYGENLKLYFSWPSSTSQIFLNASTLLPSSCCHLFILKASFWINKLWLTLKYIIHCNFPGLELRRKSLLFRIQQWSTWRLWGFHCVHKSYLKGYLKRSKQIFFLPVGAGLMSFVICGIFQSLPDFSILNLWGLKNTLLVFIAVYST